MNIITMKVMQMAWIGMIAGVGISQAKGAVSAPYKLAELNYVVLAEGAEMTSHPISTLSAVPASRSGSEMRITVQLDQVLQSSLAGLGGAFNEQGGDAFMRLSEDARQELAEALFNPESGAGLTFCRTAIGSSDFGLGAYSYSETAEDYRMEHFSVERDTTSVIPFIRAAMAENPELKMFASPWSPPGWMKTNGVMAPGKGHDRELNVLKNDPKIYAAYALYFEQYVKAYAKQGVTIDRIVVQNETDMSPIYPGCDMHPDQMAELISNYIRPEFQQAGLKTEIWAGSFRGVNQRGARKNEALNFMKEKGRNAADGLGLQYCATSIIQQLRNTYPDLKLMHTEGRCANGMNTFEQARDRFGEIAGWLNSGCENYCYWNMVLNEEGKSGWGWSQNSLVRIDRKTGEVFYNKDFAPVALLSRFIRPGDQLLKVDAAEKTNAIAVRNDNGVTVFLENQASTPSTQQIRLADELYNVELPANSVCALKFK